MTPRAVLVLNAGSSSLKFAVFDADRHGRRLLHGAASGIAARTGEFTMIAMRNSEVLCQSGDFATHEVALRRVLQAVSEVGYAEHLVGIGHRVAHGGPNCDCPKRVSPALLGRLRGLVSLAPLHLPANIQGIEAVRQHDRAGNNRCRSQACATGRSNCAGPNAASSGRERVARPDRSTRFGNFHVRAHRAAAGQRPDFRDHERDAARQFMRAGQSASFAVNAIENGQSG